MSDSFITPSDLGVFLQRDDIDPTLGALVCAAASDLVRNYCDVDFTVVEDDEVLLDGSGTGVLILPDPTVRSVAAVFVDDEEVTDYALGAAGLLYRTPAAAVWPAGPLRVRVFFDHGFTTVPRDVHIIALTLAARIYAAGGLPDDTPQISQLLPYERTRLDRYRDRGYRPPVWREPTPASSSSSSSSS